MFSPHRTATLCIASLGLLLACSSGDPSAASAATTGSGGSTSSTAATGGTGGVSGSTGGFGGTGAAGGSTAAAGGGGSMQVPFDPYFADNFESYADGASLSANNPFDAAGRTKASTVEAFRGTQSARMEILAGDNGGFGQWGGGLPINPSIPKGGEIWVRLQVFWPASFQFTATPFMKFLRLHDRQNDGSNGGYNDLYVNNADGTTNVLQTIKEIHNIWAYYSGTSLPRDQWESYEMYLYVDDQPVDAGGEGRVRIWRDNTLIFDRTDVPTITGPGGSINLFYLFTYWNNESPPDNYCFVDDLIIATDASPPTNTDGAGNAYIGDYTW